MPICSHGCFLPDHQHNFSLGSSTGLIAQMEGAANCTTTLKLKKDNTFVERINFYL
jgi:hypothetical protein